MNNHLHTTMNSPSTFTKTEPTPSRCDCCGAVEGEAHPIRGMEVSLESMKLSPQKQACQICLLHYQELPPFTHKKIIQPIQVQTFFTYLFFGFMIILAFSAFAIAQPPGLPGTPDQAPIDGGLSLLAAAGGAYALKKLRNQTK